MKLSLKKKETMSEESVDSVSEKTTPKKKSSKKRLRVISILLVIVIAVGCFFAYGKLFGDKNGNQATLTAVAQVGSVSSVIEGSGNLEALEQYDITSLIKGEVMEDYFEVGDMVAEGDILYRMDDEAGYDAIDNAQSAVNKAQRSYNNATDDISNLVVKAKTNGVVTQMYIEAGDNVNANTKVADVIDNSNMILEIQFLSDYASSMTAGVSTASVTLSKDGTPLTGKVTKVSSGEIISQVGAKVTNVEITVPNPGAIKAGDYATAEVNGLSCSSEGTFKNAGKSSIYTEVSGEVQSVKIMTGDNITYGQTVAVLTNENLTDLDETQESLSEAQDKYNDAVEALEDYVVKAPISGKIIEKNIKAGEKLESTNSTVMAVIADLSSLEFQMSVDELDITKLEVGMEVEITADAIENVVFSGKVTARTDNGTVNNGVATYPVTITLDPKEQQTGAAYENYDKLRPGFSVSASVVIERVENVIVVPVSAVRRGNIVIVSEDSSSEGIGMDAASMGTRGGTSFEGRGNMSQRSDGMPAFGMSSDGSAPSGMPPRGGNMSPAGSSDRAEKASGDTEASTPNLSQSNERLQAMIDSLEIPDGYKAIIVETGLSDESYIEIKSGLAEGDVVLLPDTTASQGQQTMQGGMPGGMGGMPGGMGGGMPGGMGGGMPAGGNRMQSGSQSRSGSMGGGMR